MTLPIIQTPGVHGLAKAAAGDRLLQEKVAREAERKAAQPRDLLALDLGQAKDYSALAHVEMSVADARPAAPPAPPPAGGSRVAGGRDLSGGMRRAYACRDLRRWQLGTSYLDVVEDVKRLAGALEKAGRRAVLLVDGTGVGRGVVDIFKQARLPVARLVPVAITAGADVHQKDDWLRVPKRDLVASAQAALQERRLRIAGRLPEAATLVRELKAFRVKVDPDTRHESFDSWREKDHDDLLFALCLALWYGERYRRPALYC